MQDIDLFGVIISILNESMVDAHRANLQLFTCTNGIVRPGTKKKNMYMSDLTMLLSQKNIMVVVMNKSSIKMFLRNEKYVCKTRDIPPKSI